MDINIDVKIKLDNGTKLTLKNEEAKALYLKLKEIYEKEQQITYYPWYWIYSGNNWKSQPNTVLCNSKMNSADNSVFEISYQCN